MQYAIRKSAKAAREVCGLEAADAAFVSGHLRRDRLAALSVSWLRGLCRRQAPLVRSSRRNGVRAPLPRTSAATLPWHYVRSPLSDDRPGVRAGFCSFRRMAGASRPPIRAVWRSREGESQPIVVGAFMLALVRCRECDSKLLQLERIWLLSDGRRVADRRCPECGTRDRVTVGAFAAKLWLAREQRFRCDLIDAADRLAGGAGLPVAAFVRTPRS